MNLFEAVEGRRSEDLATQALLVILESPAFRELQRLFYERVLRDGALLSTEDRHFRVATQESDPQLGRPDLKIEGEDTLILLENKLSAKFTYNQLPRYEKILTASGKAQKILVLVCPNHLRAGYEREIVNQFGQVEPIGSFKELQSQLLSRQIKLVIITWEDLLRVLDSGHFLITELASFIRERFLVQVEFTARELERILSPEIPELLEKIYSLVDRVKGEIDGGGIVVGRSSQSIRYWGFNLVKNKTGFYFGYMLKHWVKYKTPLIIHTSPTWQGNGHLDEESLINAGFIKESDVEFLVPISFPTGEPTAALMIIVSRLQEIIAQVADDRAKD